MLRTFSFFPKKIVLSVMIVCFCAVVHTQGTSGDDVVQSDTVVPSVQKISSDHSGDEKVDAMITLLTKKLESLGRQDQFEKLSKLAAQIDARTKSRSFSSLIKKGVGCLEAVFDVAKGVVIIGCVIVGSSVIWSLYKTVNGMTSGNDGKGQPLIVFPGAIDNPGQNLLVARLMVSMNGDNDSKAHLSTFGRTLKWLGFGGSKTSAVSINKEDLQQVLSLLQQRNVVSNSQPAHA